MSKEAMKLALEAMQYADACLKKQLTTKTKHEYAQDLLLEAGKALEEALAKQEQSVSVGEHLGEPVAWMRQDGQRVTTASDRYNYPDYETRYSIPLYTTPQQRTWVGLDEEDDIDWEEGGSLRDLVEAVEAKLKEKNK
jgi:hypothetical protein